MDKNQQFQFKIDEDDEKEIENMPLCAEKLMMQLLNKISTKEQTSALIEDWSTIERRLEIEGQSSYEVNLISKDIKIFLQQDNLINAFQKLKELHSILRDLNIPKLFRLIIGNNDALELVKGKNIHLFIGLTRTGIVLIHIVLFSIKMKNINYYSRKINNFAFFGWFKNGKRNSKWKT